MFRILFLALLLSGFNAFAQGVEKPKAVTTEELTETMHPKDSGAVAAYKYRYGKTWFERNNNGSWTMITEVYTRLKIYKKAGLEYANSEIAYYSDTRRAKGWFSDAVTYNLADGKIEKTPLKKEGEFKEEVVEDFIVKKIVMPNVREGSVIDFKYTIRTPYFVLINDWYFQFAIPADDVKYELLIPTYFKYNVYTTGFVPIEEKLVAFVKNDKNDVSDQFHSYKAVDVPALKNEKYVNNIENYTAVLKHEFASLNLPGTPTVRRSGSWENIAKEIYLQDSFGKEIDNNTYFVKDLDSIIKPGYTARQKVDSIYAFVRDRMEWNKRVGYFCKDGVVKAYTAKKGNVAEINLMLIAMLRRAGVEANPVLVSTRSNGIAVFPTPMAFNYVIVAASIGEHNILLDATGKYAMPDILPERVLNWNGRLVKKNGESVEIDLMPRIISHDKINVVAQMDANGSVKGRARNLHSEYIGHVLKELLTLVRKEDYIEKLESAHEGVVISNYKLLNDKTAGKILTEEYDFDDTMAADVLNDKIYFSPMLFFSMDENPFLSETRNFPIDFTYPVQQRHMINIALPEGYKVDHLPEQMMLSLEDNIGAFRYNITVTNNIIQLSATFEINYAIIPQQYYASVKKFFQQMIEKQQEKIVLTKV